LRESKSMLEEKTVKVSVDVWEVLMKLKIDMRAKSLDEVIRELLKRADLLLE